MTQPFSHDVAVCIGRFQPVHHGHLALLRRALSLAPRCVVVLGSAFQARSPRHPFTWQERAEMVRLALEPGDRDRVRFLPVRDFYDTPRWAAEVREGMDGCLAEWGQPIGARIVRVAGGAASDADIGPHFPGWAGNVVESVPDVQGKGLRDALFQGAERPEAALAALVGALPDSTRDFLRAWTALPRFGELAEEWRMLRQSREEWAGSPYPPVFVTVDAVLRCAGQVLLVRRGRAPGRGLLALPGGFVEQRETLWESAVRELREETSLTLPDELLRLAFKGSVVFDHPQRSQRGRTITHAHHFELGDGPLPEVRGGDDAAAALWVPVAELPSLEDRFHDDHFHVLDHFLGLLPRPGNGAG